MEDIILKITLTGGIIAILLGFIMRFTPYDDITKNLAVTIVILFFTGVLISIFGTLILIWIK